MWPVLALAAVLSVAHALATPAFWPVDETSHVAYADHLAYELAVPRIDDPIPVTLDYPGLDDRIGWERVQLRYGRQDIWTANHPPLAYAGQAVGLRVGTAIAGPGFGMFLARLTSTAWLVVGVWASMQLAFLLAPARRDRRRMTPVEVAYAAGTLVAVTPTLSHLGGLVFNDVPAFALSTLVLYHGVRAAVGGLTPRRLQLLGVVAGLAALTRVTALPAVGIAVLLGAYGWWRDPVAMRVPARTRSLVLAGLAFVPAAVFWLRNIVVYGDLTGSAYLLAKFERDLNTPVEELVPDRFFWLKLWDRMLADLTTGHWAVGTRAHITEAVLLLVLAGVAWWAAQRLFLRRTPPPGGRGTAESTIVLDTRARSGRLAAALRAHPARVAWAGCAVVNAALLVSMVQFHAAGGSLHGRYMIGGMAITATVMVLAIDGLPWVGRHLAVAVALPLFIVNASLVQALNIHQSGTWSRIDIDLVLPLFAGEATETVTLLLAAVGVALLATITVQHRRSPRPRVDGGAESRRAGRYDVSVPNRSSRESAAL
ncbi:hypothetical protein [Euzebya sp.]|uniref:hypothetical protein n=1 Tax=Euzebya sp. TaxID=1971409 RepID=UPI0035196A6B